MKRLILGLLACVCVSGIAHAQPPTPAPSPRLLAADDLVPLGFYDVMLTSRGLDNPFAQGLAGCRVNGDFRLLFFANDGRIHEISTAGIPFGGTIQNETAVSSVLSAYNGQYVGLFCESMANGDRRLWMLNATDYLIDRVERIHMVTRTVHADGSFSDAHEVMGPTGVSAKQAFGGAQRVPVWFQQRYGVGPYAIGWGGYTSGMCAGPASLGTTMFTIPDPTTIAEGAEMPASAFRTVVNHASGSCAADDANAPADWYAGGAPVRFDRGQRLSSPINYMDDGDYRANGPGPDGNQPPPTRPPLATARWLSPAPDGYGRWTWGDTNLSTGVWIDTTTVRGFVTIPSLARGKAWYCAGTLCYDGREFELHIFDPDTLGEAATGARPVWDVHPASMTPLDLPGLGVGGSNGGSMNNAGGAVFDCETGRLYVMGYSLGMGYLNRLYVFQVRDAGVCADATVPPVVPPPPTPPPPTPQAPPPLPEIRYERICQVTLVVVASPDGTSGWRMTQTIGAVTCP